MYLNRNPVLRPEAALAVARPVASPSRSRSWLGAFEWCDGRIRLRKTGNSAALDARLLAEVAIWLGYHVIVRARSVSRLFSRSAAPRIWFTPDVPEPWYMVRTAALWAGIRLARTPAEADAAFFFDDATTSHAPAPQVARHFNFAGSDISKSRVARVFGEVLGYSLAVDPKLHVGPALEKGEANGAHDGRVVECPLAPLPGKVYQRLIDTIGADGLHREFRTHVVGGKVVAVWEKRRLAAQRFLPPNVSAERRVIEAVFTTEECDRIGRFALAMGLDWTGLDILRDRSDGRLYIVDANKTDAGPIIALSLREKLASTATLAAALLTLIDG